MPIVSRGDDDEDETTAAAGAPPALDIEFDPNDPDQVKVHYNLTGWSFEQRAELAETLAERSVPHRWEGEELVVPEQIEETVDAIFDQLEEEIGPFPVPLLADEDRADGGVDGGADGGAGGVGVTEFDLSEWPPADIELLQRSLNEAEIPHRWEGRTLVVAHDAEHTVDELLDAIEAGEVASLDEDADAPDGALDDLYVYADRLARDTTDTTSRRALLALVPQLSADAPPFGLATRAWAVIVGNAQALTDLIDEGAEPEVLAAAADELRTVCRPYV